MSPFRAPYISQADLETRAEAFLQRLNAARQIPVPIERMIESMGIDIVPVPELFRNFQIDGWTTHDLKEIYVDEHAYDSVEVRFRFTLAHEVGHIELHAAAFKPYRFKTVAQWQSFMEDMDDKQREYLEHHANEFAARVLMPRQELVRVHKSCSDIVLRQVPRLRSDPAGFRHFVALCLSKRFNVSTEAARIRISNEPSLKDLP